MMLQPHQLSQKVTGLTGSNIFEQSFVIYHFSKTGQQGGSSVATGTHGITAGTNAGTTVTGVNGTTGTVRTAADTGANGAATGSVTASGDQTAASTGALTKSEYGQLAQTGIGISLACAAILLLAGLAYAMKTFVQYKRETSED
mgnify:CR=1 FL=1